MKLARGITKETFWLAVTRLLQQESTYCLTYNGLTPNQMAKHVQRLHGALQGNIASRLEARRLGSMLASRTEDNPLTEAGEKVLERCNELQVLYRAAYRKARGEYRFNSAVYQLIMTEWGLLNQFVVDHVKYGPDIPRTIAERNPPAWTLAPRGTWKALPEFGRLYMDIYLDGLLSSGATRRCRAPLNRSSAKALLGKFDRLADTDAGLETLKWLDENQARTVHALVHYGNTLGGYPVLGVVDCRFDERGEVTGIPFESERLQPVRVLMFK